MTDLIIFLPLEKLSSGGLRWDFFDKKGYHLVKVDKKNGKTDRVIFIDDSDTHFDTPVEQLNETIESNNAIKEFIDEKNGPFSQISLLIQHQGSKCHQCQQTAVKNFQENGGFCECLTTYNRGDDNEWPDIEELAKQVEEKDEKKMKCAAVKLLGKYDVHFKFWLLDQIVAKLILEIFDKNTTAEEVSEPGKQLILEILDKNTTAKEALSNTHTWKKFLKAVFNSDTDVLEKFLKIANKKAEEYFEEINSQQTADG